MNNKVVFFGEADYGKTTIIGYLLSEAERLDMDRVERHLREKLGKEYNDGLLYSSLINEHYLLGKTTSETKTYDISELPDVEEGTQIIKDTDEELIKKETRIVGKKVEITTIVNIKGVISRFNTRVRDLRNISIDGIDIVVVDTPGHGQYKKEREIGMSIGDVGVFCLAIDEILSDSFDEERFRYTDLWRMYQGESKFIYLLTKFDLCQYNEKDYNVACEKIRRFCKSVIVNRSDTVFDIGIDVLAVEDDIAAIVPVAIEFKERNGVNIRSLSDKTPWYKGPTLVEAIRSRMEDIQETYNVLIPQNTLVAVDEEIGKTFTHVGKVWRVRVCNGSIEVEDKIKFCNVSIEGMQGIHDVEAEIKSIHAEYHASEGVREVQRAPKGGLVAINVKNCYLNGRRIDKGDIRIRRETVIYSSEESTTNMNEFFIRIPNIDDKRELFDVGQDLHILWFGKRLTAKIIRILKEEEGIFVKLTGEGVALSIPDDFYFQNLDELKETVLTLQKGVINAYQRGNDNTHYIEGEFVFSRSRFVE